MPVTRQVIAQEGEVHVERVTAPAHGGQWGGAHEAQQWRCILPGEGLVHWRGGQEMLFVDPLTAFRLAPGDVYQLRHDGLRDHVVYCSGRGSTAQSAARAWLVRPKELFHLRRASIAVRKGDLGVTPAGAVVRSALERAHVLDVEGSHSVVLRARQFLARTAAETLSMEEVGEEVGASPFHLSRVFHRHTGASPHQYRLHLRLASAMQRLQEGEADLTGLAYDLGFCSQSHFGEVLMRLLGCTPGQARRALAG